MLRRLQTLSGRQSSFQDLESYLPNGTPSIVSAKLIQLPHSAADIICGQSSNVGLDTVPDKCLSACLALIQLSWKSPYLCNHKTYATASTCHESNSSCNREQVDYT